VQVQASTDSPLATTADTIAIGVFEDEGVAHDLPGGQLEALLDHGEGGRAFKRLALTHHDSKRVILVGLGRRDEFDGERARCAAGIVQRRAHECRTRTLCWELPHHVDDAVVEGLVGGTMLADYRFTRYKPAPVGEPALEGLIVSAHHDVGDAVARAVVLTDAQNRARDLGNLAPNELTPAALADYAVALAAEHDTLACRVLDGEQIRELGMGAFAAVAQGSDEDPRLIELTYEPADAPDPRRLGLVGKAVTFDSGGLTVKPPTGLLGMKFDMCGGAAVIEAIAALAQLGALVRVLGVVGATENMINGHAAKVGDVITAFDGTTIEINNPDAEGRMVLADCITHARHAGVDAIVDIATLTGASMRALGTSVAGVMGNNQPLIEEILRSAAATGESAWQLPLERRYREQLNSDVADLKNMGGPNAGAITAALFLDEFTGGLPWAHVDIAGTAQVDKPAGWRTPGCSGFGARLLADLMLNFTPGERP
jgi:leucyl aminopeptidase